MPESAIKFGSYEVGLAQWSRISVCLNDYRALNVYSLDLKAMQTQKRSIHGPNFSLRVWAVSSHSKRINFQLSTLADSLERFCIYPLDTLKL